MAFATPEYTKAEVNRAGEILSGRRVGTDDERIRAWIVLANYRACHAYPINTFQALLRLRLKEVDLSALVAQRLKRSASIIAKLQRFDGMNLARMQDIGGLRAVVGSLSRVRRLELDYRRSRFKHELISEKDYILEPKPDGYRSIHLIYRYRSPTAPEYDGLSIELQLRTKLQHAWATAVETMGTFLGQALKSGQGERNWREFFSAASAAIAIVEKSPPVPGYEELSSKEVFGKVAAEEAKLHVLDKLDGFAIAANRIHKLSGQGAYHLVVLDSQSRTVSIRPFSLARLDEANEAYATIEARAAAGDSVEAVLVSAGPIDALRKAYPNYFLDTRAFVNRIRKVIKDASAEA